MRRIKELGILQRHNHMKCTVHLVLLAFLASMVQLRSQDTTGSTNQAAGVSIRFIGFKDKGPLRTVTSTTLPATNRGILPAYRPVTLPTNSVVRTAGGPAAVFQFTNASTLETSFTVRSLEYKGPAGWKAVSTVGAAGTIPPMAAVTRAIPVDDTNVEWRVTASCVERAAGLPRAVENIKEWGSELATGMRVEHYSGRKYQTTSPGSGIFWLTDTNAAIRASANALPPLAQVEHSHSDAELTRMIVGIWVFSMTNSVQWMTTTSTFHTDGTYSMEGAVGLTTNQNRIGTIGDNGTWSIKDGLLRTIATNEASARIDRESRDRILSIDTNSISYQTRRGQIRTGVRKP